MFPYRESPAIVEAPDIGCALWVSLRKDRHVDLLPKIRLGAVDEPDDDRGANAEGDHLAPKPEPDEEICKPSQRSDPSATAIGEEEADGDDDEPDAGELT